MVQTPAPPRMLVRRFSVDEYYAMAEAGILGAEERVELLDGEVVQMAPIGSQHSGAVGRIAELLWSSVSGRAIVWVQNPVRLDEHSEPQPDLALLSRRPDFYTQSHPGPADVMLLVEVMQTSADYDRVVKIPLYARAGIPEVWLVDLEAGAVEVFRGPRGAQYRERIMRERGEAVRIAALPDTDLRVEDMLG